MKNLKTSYQKLIITKITYHSYLFKCYNYYVMSMKKILIIILFIISITLLFTLKSINNKNTSLEKEISTKQQLIKDKEKEKIDKTEELNKKQPMIITDKHSKIIIVLNNQLFLDSIF